MMMGIATKPMEGDGVDLGGRDPIGVHQGLAEEWKAQDQSRRVVEADLLNVDGRGATAV